MSNNIKNNLLVEVSYHDKPKFWKGVDKMHRPLLELFGGKKVSVANNGELTSKKTQSSGWKKVAQSILVLIAWPIFMTTLTLKFFEKMPAGIEQRKGNLSVTDEKTKAVNAGKSHAQPDNSQSSEITPEAKELLAKTKEAKHKLAEKNRKALEASPLYHDFEQKGPFSYLRERESLKEGEFLIQPLSRMKFEPLPNQEEIAQWQVVIKKDGILIVNHLYMLESGCFNYENGDSEHIVPTFKELVLKIPELSQSGNAFFPLVQFLDL